LLPVKRGSKPELSYAYVIRFHLHPTVEVQRGDGIHSVNLCLPNGEIWVFAADAGAMAIEESGFFAALDGPRRTEQIVLRSATKDLKKIAWSFTCIAAHDRRPR
jgi:uncharacterized heparinase superfamily protein